jgi:hypothetical protein
MTIRDKKPKLRVVYPQKRAKIRSEEFQEPGLQYSLFPTRRPGALIFMHFPDVTEEEFRDTMQHANPSFVLELRFSPRFDIGGLNRGLAFQTFQEHNAIYSDLTSSLMGDLDLDEVLLKLKNFLETVRPSFDRPIVFLTNRNEFGDNFMQDILHTVSSFSATPSNVYEVPKYITG